MMIYRFVFDLFEIKRGKPHFEMIWNRHYDMRYFGLILDLL